MGPKVDIEIGVKAQRALASLQGFVGRFQGILAGITGGIGMGMLVKRGLDFNATLEDAQESLGAILLQFQGARFGSFESAIKTASGLVEDLKRKATQTKGSFEDLVDAYSALAPQMFKANVPLAKQLDLLLMLSNAVNVVARGPNARLQLLQEGRALLSGNFGPEAMLARMLFPGSSDQAMYKQALAAGNALDVLSGKLAVFAEMGRRAQNTFSGRMSNLADTFNQVWGEATKSTFETLKGFLGEINARISSTEFKEGLTRLTDFAAKIVQIAGNAALSTVERGASIGDLALGVGAAAAPFALGKTLLKLRALGAGSLLSGLEIGATRLLAGLGSGGTLAAAGAAGTGGWFVGKALANLVHLDDALAEFWFDANNSVAGGRADFARRGMQRDLDAKIAAKAQHDDEERSAKAKAESERQQTARLQALSLAWDRLLGKLIGERLSAQSPLANRTWYISTGEARAALESANISRRMLDELRLIRENLTRGIKLDPSSAF